MVKIGLKTSPKKSAEAALIKKNNSTITSKFYKPNKKATIVEHKAIEVKVNEQLINNKSKINITNVKQVAEFDLNGFVLIKDGTNKVIFDMTALEKMNLVRTGVSKKTLKILKEHSTLDYDKLARALSVTRPTLINKKLDEKFNSALSERIVSLGDIYSYGYQVFDDVDRFNKWMFIPNKVLGGQMPFDLIDNQFGREEVKNIIGRINYGVFS